MVSSEKPTDYDNLLVEICSQLFKKDISLNEGLPTFRDYVTSGKGWFFDKPVLVTLMYWDIQREKRPALTSGLEELHAAKEKQNGTLLSLDAVVAVAYKQQDPFDRRALLLLGHEFKFYTINDSSNPEYALDPDSKQNIASLITKVEQAKAEGIASDTLMAYLLPQQGPATIGDLGAFHGAADSVSPSEERDQETATTLEMDRSTPAALDVLYTLGIRAILSDDIGVIHNLMRYNIKELRETPHRRHIARAIQAAIEQQNSRLDEAINFYEESIAITPENERTEQLYAHTLRTLLELYSTSPAYTIKIPKFYALAEEAGVALDTDKISIRVASFSSDVLTAYSKNPSLEKIQQLDALLPLAQIPGVSATLTNTYTQLMRQALAAKDVPAVKHCSDTLAGLSERVPFEGELAEETGESELLVLEYQFTALQYEVGAIPEAAEALEKCSRALQTGGAGAVHLLTAKVRLAEGNDDAALSSLEAAVAADFSDTRYKTEKREVAEFLFSLGNQYHLGGQTTEAQTAFQLTITADPTSASTTYEYAHRSFTEKKYSAALAAAERAAVVALYCPEAPREDILKILNSVGVVYKDGKETAKNLAQAKKAFTTALTLDSNSPDAHYHLGTIAMMEKDNRTAIDHLHIVIEQNPKHSWGQYQLGLAYQRAGEETLSQQHLRIAAELGHKQAQVLLKY